MQAFFERAAKCEGIENPRLLLGLSPEINLFALPGRKAAEQGIAWGLGHNTCIVTLGVLEKMSMPSIQALLYHELQHCKSPLTVSQAIEVQADSLAAARVGNRRLQCALRAIHADDLTDGYARAHHGSFKKNDDTHPSLAVRLLMLRLDKKRYPAVRRHYGF